MQFKERANWCLRSYLEKPLLHFTSKSQQDTPIDQFLVCGEDYKTIRDAVAKVVIKGKADTLDKICEVPVYTNSIK